MTATRGRPRTRPEGAPKRDPTRYKNVTLSVRAHKLLQAAQTQASKKLGFELTLSQTLHFVVAGYLHSENVTVAPAADTTV